MSLKTTVEKIHEDWIGLVLDVDSLSESEEKLNKAKVRYENTLVYVRNRFAKNQNSLGQTTIDKLDKGLVECEKYAKPNTQEGFDTATMALRELDKVLTLALRPPTDTPPGLSKLPVPVKSLKVGKTIGSGSFGEVLDLSTGTGQHMVFKVASKGNEDELQSEVDAFELIGSHDNIVKCFGMVELDVPDPFTKLGSKQTGMVMEKLAGGGLNQVFGKLDALKKAKQLSHTEYWGTLQHLMNGMFKGLAHLERVGIVHNDLKSDNVMFDPVTGESKLIDIGLVTKVGDPSKMGHEQYASPEKVDKWLNSDPSTVTATTSQDMFSAGQMLHKEAEGEVYAFGEKPSPRGGMQQISQLDRLIPEFIKRNDKGEFEARVFDEESTEYAGPYVDFLNQLMHPDPSQRLSATDALNHPFMTDPLLDPEEAKRVLSGKGTDSQGDEVRRDADMMIKTESMFLGQVDVAAKRLKESKETLEKALTEEEVDPLAILLVQLNKDVVKSLERETAAESALKDFREAAGKLTFLVTTDNYNIEQEDNPSKKQALKQGLKNDETRLEKLNGYVTTFENLLRDLQEHRSACQRFLNERQKVPTISEDELQREIAKRTRNAILKEGQSVEDEHTRQLLSAQAVKDYRDSKAWRDAILTVELTSSNPNLATELDKLETLRMNESSRIRKDDRLTESDKDELLTLADEVEKWIEAARHPAPPVVPNLEEEYAKALQSAEKGLGKDFKNVTDLPSFSQQVREGKEQFETDVDELDRQVGLKDFAGSLKTLKTLLSAGHQLLEARADYDRQAQLNMKLRDLMPDAFDMYPPGSENTVSKRADKGKRHGGLGDHFPAVITAIKDLQTGATSTRLDTLETAANDYLKHHREKYNNDKKLAKAERNPAECFRIKTCEEALANVKRLRACLDMSLKTLGPPPWSEGMERKARQMEATLLVRTTGAQEMPSGTKGASDAFFLPNEKGENQFVFKPIDGEFSPGPEWPAGGGAPREVMLSRVSELLKKSLGIDTGVAPTSLVKLDSTSIDTRGNSQRVGALQNFLPSVSLNDTSPSQWAKAEDENVQGIALLDFITLQMDRNAGNLLVQGDPDTKPEFVPIDAGNSMPTAKAFQAGQQMFGSNVMFTMPGSDKPFNAEMLEKIRQLDPDEIKSTMLAANREMESVDPSTKDKVSADSIDLVYRSTLFLKQIADKLTVKEIGTEAYAKHFHRLLPPADVGDFDKIISAILEEINEEKRQWQELERLDYIRELTRLGWPNQAEFTRRDPVRLLGIVKHGIEHPGTLREIEQLHKELGRTYDELGFDPRPLKCAARLTALKDLKFERDQNTILTDQRLLKEAKKQNVKLDTLSLYYQVNALKKIDEYLNLGGDQELISAGQMYPEYRFEDKLTAIRRLAAQKEYLNLGGDNALDPYRNWGVTFPERNVEDKVKALKLFLELDNQLGGMNKVKQRQQTGVYFPVSPLDTLVKNMCEWNEYDALGGEVEYKKRGGPEAESMSDLWNRFKWLATMNSLD